MGNRARVVAGSSTRRLFFVVLIGGEAESRDWADTQGTQVAETPDKATPGEKPPEAAQQGPSSRVPAIMVSLAALAVIGAATANALPNFNRFSMPISWPSFNRLSLPNFNGFPLPDFDRFLAPSARETASVRIPDPPVSATLKDIQLSQKDLQSSQKDIQSSQQQNAAVLVSLTQSAATQQADLKRISRQLSSLGAQVDALQGAVTPLTTSSIPRPNARVRLIARSRKTVPPLPKPFGPVSVGGAPLSPAPVPAPGSRAG